MEIEQVYRVYKMYLEVKRDLIPMGFKEGKEIENKLVSILKSDDAKVFKCERCGKEVTIFNVEYKTNSRGGCVCDKCI